MLIAVDFDGTCVFHKFPEVGSPVPGAVGTLRWLVEQGHNLVLYTMRSGRFLQEAIEFFEEHKIELTGIQYAPGQSEWTSSNKCYAQIYIDDAGLGAPLIYPSQGRPYIDWTEVTKQLSNIFSVEGEDRNPVVGGGLCDE